MNRIVFHTTRFIGGVPAVAVKGGELTVKAVALVASKVFSLAGSLKEWLWPSHVENNKINFIGSQFSPPEFNRLCSAVLNNDIEQINTLVQEGIGVNFLDHLGRNVLQFCMSDLQVETLKTLISHGINIKHQENSSASPMCILVRSYSEHLDLNDDASIEARKRQEMLFSCLLENGASLNGTLPSCRPGFLHVLVPLPHEIELCPKLNKILQEFVVNKILEDSASLKENGSKENGLVVKDVARLIIGYHDFCPEEPFTP